MFKKNKSFKVFEIRRAEKDDIYFSSTISDERQKVFEKDGFAYAYHNDFEDLLPFYYLVTSEHFYNKKMKSYDKNEFNFDRGYVILSIASSVGLVEIDKNMLEFAKALNFPYLSTNKGYYIKAEDKVKLDEIIKTDYKPYSIKGTDWPYWFEVNDTLINSHTSSWANYLFTQYNIVVKTFLESYEGPDMHMKINVH